MTTDQPAQPLDVAAVLDLVERYGDARESLGAAYDRAGSAVIEECGNHADDMLDRIRQALAEVEQLRADASLSAAEVKELREDLAELAQAHAVIDATRQMAIDANARLRTQLLEALGREDDGRTPLSGYVSHLVAQRDALKHALGKGVAEEERLRRELDTAWDVAASNKQHVATLSVLLERVEKLTVSTDGDDLDADVEIPVGEIRRAIQEPIPGEAGAR